MREGGIWTGTIPDIAVDTNTQGGRGRNTGRSGGREVGQ